MSEKQKVMTLYRNGETILNGGSIVGIRGQLRIDSQVFNTIERDITTYVHIPVGTFPLKMEYSPSGKTVKLNDGTRVRRKQFRINGHSVRSSRGGLAALLIHQGSTPDKLTGCIAPGISSSPTGILKSYDAMDMIFWACGGFEEGKQNVVLSITNEPFYGKGLGWSELPKKRDVANWE